MSSSSFGAKPAVLRCSRCGTFVDWSEARAQVMCECRQRLELPPVLVREAADAERAAALELFRRDFGRSGIVAFGQVMDLDAAPTIVAEMNGEIAGALAYRLIDSGLHIVALATDPISAPGILHLGMDSQRRCQSRLERQPRRLRRHPDQGRSATGEGP